MSTRRSSRLDKMSACKQVSLSFSTLLRLRTASLREPLISCMNKNCVGCGSGSRNICPVASFLVSALYSFTRLSEDAFKGIAGWGGGLSEYITADQSAVFPLPKGLSRERDVSSTAFLSKPLTMITHSRRRRHDGAARRCLARCQEVGFQSR